LAVTGAVTAAAVLATGGTYAYNQYKSQKKAEDLEKEYKQATGGLSVNNPDYNGNTPLHSAVQQGKSDLVKLMLERGANPNVQNTKGNTSLIVLLQSPSLNPNDIKTITKLLIEHGANPCIKNENQDDAAAFANVLSDEKLKNDILDELRKNSARCDVDRSLDGAIHALESQPQELTEEQKKLNALQKELNKNFHIDVTHGIDTADSHGYTPLMLIAASGNVDAVKLLLDAKADPNIQDPESKHTALMDVLYRIGMLAIIKPYDLKAKRSNYLKIITLLIEHGTNPCLKNESNLDAAEYIQDFSDEDKKAILDLLKKNKTGCVIKD
jgi:hypothetical protein